MTEKGKTAHRQRLRDRFLAGDEQMRSDEMLLEILLTFAIGRKDVKPLVEELIRIFGSLSQVFSATQDELGKVKGLGKASIALLKVIECIQAGATPTRPKASLTKGTVGATQQKLFDKLPDEQTTNKSTLNTTRKKSVESKQPSQSLKKQFSAQKSTKRKFQVSRSHVLEFNHFARILSYLYENKRQKRISRSLLIENTGLPDGQVASLISIGASMGLIQSGGQILTPVGLIIAEHDIFFEDYGTLEWCHYKGAGSYQNLIWFEIFNHLLVEEAAVTQEGWQEYFRNKLSGKYSDETIKDHVPKEVRFILDAYTKGNFSKLELLNLTPDEFLYRRRYTRFTPLVLSAMIYDFCAEKETHLFQVGEMAAMPGSPAVVFGLDAFLFRQQIEGLHDRGWLRYETTHNLDQIRLKPGYSAMEFLTAYFEDREPREDNKPSPGGIFQ